MLLHFGGSEVRPSDKNITQCVFITTKSMPLPLVHIPLFNANLMSSCSFQVLINSKMPRFTEPVEKQIPSSQECRRGGGEGGEKCRERKTSNCLLLGTDKIKSKNMERIVLYLMSCVRTDEISLDIIKYVIWKDMKYRIRLSVSYCSGQPMVSVASFKKLFFYCLEDGQERFLLPLVFTVWTLTNAVELF